MRKYLFRSLLVAFASTAIWLGYSKISSDSEEKNHLGLASIVAVNHLGRDYDISEVYVNKTDGGFAGREGGGGTITCCIMIPSRWRPGLTVEVRWEVGDWSHENRAEVDAGNYRSLGIKGMYIAKVPVEKYDTAGNLYVHFFPKGRVRVVSSTYSVLSPSHPVPYGPSDGGVVAKAGWPIKELFSQAELSAMERKRRNAWR